MGRHDWVNASNALKKETILAAEALGPLATQILDRWASGWKKRTLALEAAGELIPALEAQKDRELEVQRLTEPGGEYAWVGAMEMRQLWGVDESPPYPRQTSLSQII